MTAYTLYLKLLFAALSGRATEADREQTRARLRALPPDDRSANAVMMSAVDMTHAEWLGLNERRHRVRRAWGAFFHEWDVLLCPVLGAPTWRHMTEGEVSARRLTVGGQDVSYNDLLFWPGITGGFHLPASVAPLGLTAGRLPYGVQIVPARYIGDRTTIAVAGLLERAWRGFVPPPATLTKALFTPHLEGRVGGGVPPLRNIRVAPLPRGGRIASWTTAR